MRIVALGLLAGALCAGEIKDGVFKDTFFNLAFAPPQLKKSIGTAHADQIFRGRGQNDIRLSINVSESEKPRAAAAWLADARAAWKKKRRKLSNIAVDGARIIYTEKRLGVFDAHHGHAFVVRGPVCFEVHAWIEDKTATSETDIRTALGALRLGPELGCGLLALRIAAQRGLPPNAPKVLLEAGSHYLRGDMIGNKSDLLAAGLLTRARRELKKGALEKDQHWLLLRNGGEALLRTGHAAKAAAWFTAAVPMAPAERVPSTRYDIARAQAEAGDLDAAFAALDLAFADGTPVSKMRLSREKEFAPLRRDKRWEEFWKRRVEGR